MLTVGALCAGYGGLESGLALAGWPVRTAWHAEIDPDASAVLAHRWPGVPNHGDIRTTDWRQVERVDVLTAGFPCQDLSAAGRRAGIKPGNRSGVWLSIIGVIDTLRPPVVVIENVEGILSASADRGVGPTDPYVEAAGGHALRALGCVLGDLADLGYDARWCRVSAADVGAPHRRNRIFLLAYPANAPHLRLPGIGQPRHGRPGPADGGVGPGGLSLLPTPARADAIRGANPTGHVKTPTHNPGTTLVDAIALLPTPAARDADRGAGWGDQPGRPLSETIHRLLPTPRVSATRTGASAIRGSSSSPSLDQAVELMAGVMPRELSSWDDAPASWRLLPTPRASDGTKGGPNQRGSSGDLALPAAVQPDRWGHYGPAIARCETVTGRPAPDPTEPGRTGKPRLAPRFVEWMQGLTDGWVTAVPGLSRSAMLRLLGNGVVPFQAAYAYAGLSTTESEATA